MHIGFTIGPKYDEEKESYDQSYAPVSNELNPWSGVWNHTAWEWSEHYPLVDCTDLFADADLLKSDEDQIIIEAGSCLDPEMAVIEGTNVFN